MKRKLGLVFGGRSGEHEVSLQSAKSIAGALDRNKFDLFMLAIDKQGDWYLADESSYLEHADDPARISLKLIPEQRIALISRDGSNAMISLQTGEELGTLDVAFPIVHGTFGEDGSLQGFMAMLNIPCVGADVMGSSLGMDKVLSKEILIRARVPVAEYVLAETTSDLGVIKGQVNAKFSYPVFVKPSCSGSSVGVIKVEKEEALVEAIQKALLYDKQVLIEESIVGREIECAILGNEELFASVPGEIIPKHSFYSYEAKYIDAEGAQLEMPARISEDVKARVQETARKTYKALACSGMARVDMFLTEKNELILNEINTLPGFTKISMYPKLMELSGIPYSELITRLADLAVARHAKRAEHLKNVLSAGAY